MNISGITRANFVLPSHRDNLLRGINVNVLTVNTLVSVDAAFSLVGVIINAIVSYGEKSMIKISRILEILEALISVMTANFTLITATCS